MDDPTRPVPPPTNSVMREISEKPPSATRAPASEAAPPRVRRAPDDRSCDYRTLCPNCGAVLVDRGCKSRCSRCHFFTDCSDPW